MPAKGAVTVTPGDLTHFAFLQPCLGNAHTRTHTHGCTHAQSGSGHDVSWHLKPGLNVTQPCGSVSRDCLPRSPASQTQLPSSPF